MFQCRFVWQAHLGSAPCQESAERECLVAVAKTMAGVGRFKQTCKDAFRVAGTVRETSSSKMLGGQGADFLRGVAFWSIRSRFAKMILRDRCSTSFSWQVRYFRL